MAFKVTSSGIHVRVSKTVIVALRFKLTCDVSLCASFLFLYTVKVIYRASFLILSVSLKHIRPVSSLFICSSIAGTRCVVVAVDHDAHAEANVAYRTSSETN